MNFEHTSEQEMLRDTVRAVLAAEASTALAQVRALNDGTAHLGVTAGLDDGTLWRRMADLGWLGLPFPTQYGGGEASFMDLAVVLEEMGRAVAPPAYTATVALAGLTLLRHGTAEQREAWLPRIAAGDARIAVAVADVERGLPPSVQAVREDGSLVLDGVARHVEEASRSDAMLLPVVLHGDTRLVLVPRDAPGTTLRPQRTTAGGDRADVHLERVRADAAAVLGGAGALDDLLARGAVAMCLDMVGAGAAVLESAVAYVSERQQFGRRIGSFQAIQHHAANMVMDLDSARLVTYQAAWRIAEGLDAAMHVAMAKAWTGEAYRRIVTLGHQLFGGIGLMREHEMHLFLRRSRRDDLAFGDASVHLDRLAAVLDSVDTPWPR